MRKILRLLISWLFLFLCAFLVSGKESASNVYHAHENSGMKIALTFDDGPHPYLTPKILDVLKKYKVHATFFLVGENVKNYPDLAERILKEGHEIGNHTYTHGRVSERSFFEMRKEIELCESAIYEQTDYKTKIFRPPEGFLDDKIRAISKEMDYSVILWNIDTKDWAHATPQAICQNITEHISPGSIILMHDYISFDSPTPEALELFLPILLERGYQFSVVSDLIGSY